MTETVTVTEFTWTRSSSRPPGPGAPHAGRTRDKVFFGLFAVTLLLLAVAALNPYYLPDTYDNVLYHGTARSIADGNGYRFGAELITDWPPLFPAMLAVLHLVGWHGVLAAKSLVLVTMGIGFMLAARLARAEDRPWPHLAAIAIAACPTGFQMGTRIMAEWPYMLLSFAFLLALERLKTQRGLLAAIGTGLCLGAAGLTRYTGLFLLVAVAAQGLAQWRTAAQNPRLRAVLPELVVAGVGMLAWVAWFAFVALASQTADSAVQDAQNLSTETYRDFHPFAVARAAANLILCTHSVFGGVPVVADALTLTLLAFAIAGVVIRARGGRMTPSDFYTFAFLGFLMFYERGETPTLTRYLLPVGPFLFGLVFEAVRVGASRVPDRFRTVARAVAAAWLLAFLAVDARLLVAGKPDGPHAGLSVLASPDAESFYRREWLDLYRASRFIREVPEPGAVSELPNSTRYLAAWTGRDLIETRDGRPVRADAFQSVVFLVTHGAAAPPPGFERAAAFRSVTVWRRTARDANPD